MRTVNFSACRSGSTLTSQDWLGIRFRRHCSNPVQPQLRGAVVAGERDRGRGNPSAGKALVNPVADIAAPQRAHGDSADCQLAHQLALESHGPRQNSARTGLPAQPPHHRPKITRDLTGTPALRWQGGLPLLEPILVAQSDCFPCATISPTKWSQRHRAIGNGDRPSHGNSATKTFSQVRSSGPRSGRSHASWITDWR